MCLPALDQVHHPGGLGRGVRAHGGFHVEAAHAERDAGDRRQLRIPVEHAGEGVVEDGPVVDAGADHHLAVDLDAVVEEGPQPAQAGGAPAVAQHPGPHLGVGGVDAHPERRQTFGHHPLQVGLGESGQGGEVPVQERQAVVVVPGVEAAPHALGELVDEAELAVVVAGPDPVEQGRVQLHAERLGLGSRHPDQAFQAAAAHVELELRLIGEELVFDDVSGELAVHGDDLVAGLEAGPGGRATRGPPPPLGAGT